MKRITQRLLILGLVGTMCVTPHTLPSLQSVQVQAATEVVTSGKCGDNITWKYEDGTLTLTGSGEMYDYDTEAIENRPAWDNITYRVKQLVLDDRITRIGNTAFSYQNQLTEVKLPESLVEVGEYSFSGCTELTHVTLPDGLKRVGQHAFHSCNSLQNIKIPESLETIGTGAFSGCESFTCIDLAKVSKIENGALSYCVSLESVTIPSTVTELGAAALMGCQNLKDVIIEAKITSLQSFMFDRCYSLNNVVLPDTITSIDDGAFLMCRNLESIYVPDSVTTLGNQSFIDCTNLKSIYLPSTLTSIGSEAFKNDTSLTDVYFYGTEEEWNSVTKQEGNDQLNDVTMHFLGDEHSHTWEAETTVVDATCTKSGIKSYTCPTCTATITVAIPATGHAWGDWTEKDAQNHQKVCQNDASHIETQEHSWNEGVVQKAATLTEKGTMLYTCTVCGETKTTEIPVVTPEVSYRTHVENIGWENYVKDGELSGSSG